MYFILSIPWAIDALVEDEGEMENKQKKRMKGKKQGAGPQSSYSGPFDHLLWPTDIIWWVYSDSPLLSKEIHMYIIIIKE